MIIVVSVEGSSSQLMDLESYEVYSLPVPEDLRGKLKSGNEVEIIEASGRRAISRNL